MKDLSIMLLQITELEKVKCELAECQAKLEQFNRSPLWGIFNEDLEFSDGAEETLEEAMKELESAKINMCSSIRSHLIKICTSLDMIAEFCPQYKECDIEAVKAFLSDALISDVLCEDEALMDDDEAYYEVLGKIQQQNPGSVLADWILSILIKDWFPQEANNTNANVAENLNLFMNLLADAAKSYSGKAENK